MGQLGSILPHAGAAFVLGTGRAQGAQPGAGIRQSCVGRGPGCPELLQCCGLSCPGAGHVSLALLSPRANLVFPSSTVQTLILPGHRAPAQGLELGCSALSSPGCFCPAQGAWHSPGSHWQCFFREGETSSNHLWLISGSSLPVKSALCPQQEGNAVLDIPSPEQGEKQSTELPEHGSSVQPGDTGCPHSCGAVQGSPGEGSAVGQPSPGGAAQLLPHGPHQTPPSAASSWGYGVTWAWLWLRLCCPSPPKHGHQPCWSWPCSVGWPCVGLAVGVCV